MAEQLEWLNGTPEDDGDGCPRCWFTHGRPAPETAHGVPGGCRWCIARREPEARIVWLEDVERLDYVRQSVYDYFPFRQRRPSWRHHDGRLVGYAELKPEAPSDDDRRFRRRVFWLKDHDRDGQPSGVYRTGTPSEGVDPRTVAPNVRGRVTERAWGGRLAQVPGAGGEEDSDGP